MNTRAKGKKLEKLAKEILEAGGWTVEQANPKLQFIGPGKVISKAHDLFGKWDFVCVSDQEVQPLWVQVSVWDMMSVKIKQVAGFPKTAGFREIWLWYSEGKHGHFRILKGNDDYEWKGDCEMRAKKKC